jgi:hypothetical protein
MDEMKNKPEPKKIKMPPLVDRSILYDTMSWTDDSLDAHKKYENYSKNNSESVSKLESYETD